MLHEQLFNVNTTCHDIPLGGSGSSATPAVPRPLGSTFSQSDSRVIPIPTPFKCFNGDLLKGGNMKRTSRRTVLLKCGDMEDLEGNCAAKRKKYEDKSAA